MNSDGEHRYTSRDHPGRVPWGLVLAREGVRPLSVLMLPLMIITLFIALSAGDLLGLIAWSYPLALIIAGAWTAFTLERRIAEIRLTDAGIELRSVADCAYDRPSLPVRLFDVRDYGGWLVVAAGDSDFVISREDWPSYEDVRRELRSRLYPQPAT